MAVFPDSTLVSTLTSQSTFDGVYDIFVCARSCYAIVEDVMVELKGERGHNTASIYMFEAFGFIC